MPAETEQPKDETGRTDLVYSEDFVQGYANNVRFEPSVWDLNLLFGELDRTAKPWEVNFHTGMTIPWAQAKLMAYFLLLNIRGYEVDSGPITVPASIMPPHPDSMELNETHDVTVRKFAKEWYDVLFTNKWPVLGRSPGNKKASGPGSETDSPG